MKNTAFPAKWLQTMTILNNSDFPLSKGDMTVRLLITVLAAASLTSGCTKSFSNGKQVGEHSRISFHSRDMIVPDFNSGRTVRCPDRNTI